MLRLARGAVHMLLLQVICTDLIGDEWYCQHTENPSIISECCGTVEPLRSQHKLARMCSMRKRDDNEPRYCALGYIASQRQ